MDGLGQVPWDALNGVGVIGLCVLAVVALARGWVIPGPWHRERITALTSDRDEWRGIALRSLTVTERATDASEVAASALAALPEALEGRS